MNLIVEKPKKKSCFTLEGVFKNQFLKKKTNLSSIILGVLTQKPSEMRVFIL